MRRPSSARPPQHAAPAERGSALIMVVLALLAVSGLATAMLVVGQTNQLIAANERDSERALAASKAGLIYAFKLFYDGTIDPDEDGTAFDSFDADVAAMLEDAQFDGMITQLSATQGQLYRVDSTGTYNRASRTTEMVFQVVPEALKFGYIGFNKVTLHNHSGFAGPAFRIESTIFSGGAAEVPEDLTLEGSVVAADAVKIGADSTVMYDVFANSITNSGTIQGDAKTVTAMLKLPVDATTYNRLDASGNKYNWYLGNSTPGTISGGVVLGQKSSYLIQNGDVFDSAIFYDDGSLILDPKINVVQYVPPPLIDYQAMKAEADKNDATYFSTAAAFYNYLRTKKVGETVGGFNVTTVKVGTPAKPEFIYVDASINPVFDPGVASESGATIKAHGFALEGGIYVSGSFEITEAIYKAPPAAPIMPPPPDYYSFSVNALPYCYPAIIAYPEPSSGTLSTWEPDDTPALGNGDINMSSQNPNGGFVYLNGVTYSGGKTHLHHVKSASELIRLKGAELAEEIHNCDFLWFTYDPAVRCTKFLSFSGGTPGVVSYREVR